MVSTLYLNAKQRLNPGNRNLVNAEQLVGKLKVLAGALASY